MGIEIERKYLCTAPAGLESAKRRWQGYLSESSPVVRVRHTVGSNGVKQGWLTIKGQGTLSRTEYEYEIPAGDAAEMLNMCVNVIEKTRYRWMDRWEVDEFHGSLQGLWLAEIELTSVDEVVNAPRWVGLEVTEDVRYTNVELSRSGVIPLV